MNSFEEKLIYDGYESKEEFRRLIDQLDLSTIENLERFDAFIENDGSKEGLLHLIKEMKKGETK